MGATNSTTYYELPVFVSSDEPKWLVDWNGAMALIDAGIHQAQADATQTATDLGTLSSTVSTLAGTVTTQGTSITTITGQLTSLQGTVNTITELIGNGTPTTSDKTIIGAINEIYAMIGGGTELDAVNVVFNNTGTGLLATNVQSAIEEVKSLIPSIVSDVEVQSGTLTAGSTSVVLTFVSQTIGSDTLIDIYTDTFGVNPTAVATTSTTVTLTFEAQLSDVVVAVKVAN